MKKEKECRQECNAAILESGTLSECSNERVKPIGKSGPLVAKIPVVIAEPKIQVDVESVIRLEEPALEIKRIKKNVFVTQCKLINTNSLRFGKLFLSGFVRKNIEYATVDCIGERSISGDIRHTTVNVPFQCVTKVFFENSPVTCTRGITTETEFFTDQIRGCDPCSENILGHSPCEQDFQDYECFTEKFFCELEDVKIFEEDIHRDPTPIGCAFPNEQTFDTFVEKMVLFIRLKILQNQQVTIPGQRYTGPKTHINTECPINVSKHDDVKEMNEQNGGWLK